MLLKNHNISNLTRTKNEESITVFFESGEILFHRDNINKIQSLNYPNGNPKIIYFEDLGQYLIHAQDGRCISSDSDLLDKIEFYDRYLDELLAEDDATINDQIIDYFWELKRIDQQSAIDLLNHLISQPNASMKETVLRMVGYLKIVECMDAIRGEINNETELTPYFDKYGRFKEFDRPETSMGELARNVLGKLRGA